MSYEIGLVGKPSVGKSTFFNAATTNDVPEGAYPFTTIDPSVGEAYVRVDCAAPEFGDHDCTPTTGYCADETRYVPVKLIDVAGLVPGAHEGRGLGNQFLTDLNEADALVHVVDFTGETDLEGEPAEGHDPREDIDFLFEELDEWYCDVLERGIERHQSGYHGAESELAVDLAEQFSSFGLSDDEIDRLLRRHDLGTDPTVWDADDERTLATAMRRASKPTVIAANKLDTAAARENWAEITSDPDYDHLTFVPASAHAEKALRNGDEADVLSYDPGAADFEITADLPAAKREALTEVRSFLDRFGGTGVQTAIETALFDELGTMAVFPGDGTPRADGKFLQECLLVPEGTTAEGFAHAVHSEIGDGFLYATDARTGRQVGADTELSHRDVVEVTTTT